MKKRKFDTSHLLHIYVNRKPTIIGGLKFICKLKKLEASYNLYIDSIEIISYDDLNRLSHLKHLSKQICSLEMAFDKEDIDFDDVLNLNYTGYKIIRVNDKKHSIIMDLSYFISEDDFDTDIGVSMAYGMNKYNTVRDETLDLHSISHPNIDMSEEVIEGLMGSYRNELRSIVKHIFWTLNNMEMR